MARKSKKAKIIKKYKDTITYECPSRGTVSIEHEVHVYSGQELLDDETVDITKILPS